MKLEELERFIIAARENVARGQARRVPPERSGAAEILYREGGLTYRDSYFGQGRLLGQEIVRRAGTVVWGMNYWIVLADLPLPGGELASFLQRAQLERYRQRRLLGSYSWQERLLRYEDHNEGDLDKFQGDVHIFYQDRSVYHMRYCGGRLR
ncbi:MAG: hypothetical protein JXA37_05220 [Chloroflexia bacterium]|nr:hypothetical protein [Chloroflexia bacterium]